MLLQEQAQKVLMVKPGQATTAQLVEAMSHAHSAMRFFTALCKLAEPPVAAQRLQQHVAFNQGQLQAARQRSNEVGRHVRTPDMCLACVTAVQLCCGQPPCVWPVHLSNAFRLAACQEVHSQLWCHCCVATAPVQAARDEAGRAKRAEQNRAALEAAQRTQQLQAARCLLGHCHSWLWLSTLAGVYCRSALAQLRSRVPVCLQSALDACECTVPEQHMQCREAAAKQEAEAQRERLALESTLKLQALREKWAVDKAHAEVSSSLAVVPEVHSLPASTALLTSKPCCSARLAAWACLQAAHEGDADKADKRRKRKKAEAQADAVFVEEDDDGEYVEVSSQPSLTPAEHRLHEQVSRQLADVSHVS